MKAPGIAEVVRRALSKARKKTRAKTLIDHARDALRAAGFDPDPIGSGNSKTEVTSTYRRLGGAGAGTCPRACPYNDEFVTAADFGEDAPEDAIEWSMDRCQNPRCRSFREIYAASRNASEYGCGRVYCANCGKEK